MFQSDANLSKDITTCIAAYFTEPHDGPCMISKAPTSSTIRLSVDSKTPKLHNLLEFGKMNMSTDDDVMLLWHNDRFLSNKRTGDDDTETDGDNNDDSGRSTIRGKIIQKSIKKFTNEICFFDENLWIP